MMTNTIIFDFGGVLIDWNPSYLFSKTFRDKSQMDYFLKNICTSDWNEEQDGGRTLKEATEFLVEKFPEHEENIKAYYSRWEEMLGGVFQGTIDILKELKESKKYKLLGLTNWSAETFPIAKEKYDFLNWFDGIVVSGEEKCRKPFAEFYHILLKRYQVEPERAIFIDDNVRNLEGARAVGIQTIHFVSPEELRIALKEKGVL
jgi:2-haloacid dehalogenase